MRGQTAPEAPPRPVFPGGGSTDDPEQRDGGRRSGVSPGGHLVTTAVACAATATLSGSWPLTCGVAAGGFLIDLDHAVDYIVFEGQRDLRPGVFLRYYLAGRIRRAVLVLHSYEVFAVLGLAAWLGSGGHALGGYLAGGLMHLALDIRFNGEFTPRSILAFYSFAYRLRHRFDAAALLGRTDMAVPSGFWPAFFHGASAAPHEGGDGAVVTPPAPSLPGGAEARRPAP